jgi:Nuclease-related domain
MGELLELGRARVGAGASERATGWTRGDIRERRIVTLLEQLGEDWTVLHSVQLGRGKADIDHVVVGPSGVFTINTKYSLDKNVWVDNHGVYVGGLRESYVYDLERQAKWAGERLSAASGLTVPVTGVIVFVKPTALSHTAPTSEFSDVVRVIADSQLLGAIEGGAVEGGAAVGTPTFSADEIARIADAAGDTETWKPTGDLTNERRINAREFEILERGVGAKRRGQSRVVQVFTELAVPLLSIGILVGAMNWLGR